MHSSLWSTQGCLVLYSLLFMYVCSVYVCMWYIYHGQYRAFVPGYQDSQTPRQGPGSIEERNKIKETKSKKQNQRKNNAYSLYACRDKAGPENNNQVDYNL